MSIVRLADGQLFKIESPVGTRDSVLRMRERSILPIVFAEPESKFAAIEKAFSDPAKTETIQIFPHEDNTKLTDAQLFPDGDVPGPACEEYAGYTLLGETKKEDKIVEAGTPTAPPVYGRQLTIELGQRQYGEE